MRLYISTAWAERVFASELAALAETLGHTITCKWWDTPELVTTEAAISDLEGVDDAETFILLAHPEAYGAMVELGYALRGTNTTVVVAHDLFGVESHRCIFYAHPNIDIHTHGFIELFRLLKRSI